VDHSDELEARQLEPEPGPIQGTEPPRSKPKRAWELIALAAVVVVLGWRFKMEAGGWGVIIFGIPYLVIGVIHFILHCSASAKARNAKPALIVLLLASHIFFVLGFLLQIDAGDGPDFLTITYLVSGDYGLPSWWPATLWMNVLVFVPLVVTWVLMRSRSSSPQD